jgi:hypothetical protein
VVAANPEEVSGSRAYDGSILRAGLPAILREFEGVVITPGPVASSPRLAISDRSPDHRARNFDNDLVARPRRSAQQPPADREVEHNLTPSLADRPWEFAGTIGHADRQAGTSPTTPATIPPAIGAPSAVMAPPRRAGG